MAHCTVSAVRGPCTRTITAREARSRMSWSQHSPTPCSLSAASQWASFFPHEGPFLIGLDLGARQPSHRLVMHGPRVRPRHHGITPYRAARMARKPRRAADAAPLLQMHHDLLHLCCRQPGLFQRRALPLAERRATVPAAQQPYVLLLAHPLVYPQLAPLGRPLAVVRTGRIGTSKLRDSLCVHSPWSPHGLLTSQAAPVIQIPQATRRFRGNDGKSRLGVSCPRKRASRKRV